MHELLATTDSAELSEWMAFFRLEPWGHEVENWRTGQLAATVANYSGRIKKPLKPQDFIPPPPKTKRQRLQESIAKMKAFLGG
ncbi:phage tail assembly protein T [Microbulbifer sp. 2201CG32-9]|uniref:phage tail assembly protein T n=1 Tax=Microbulbifer sp. 2201CG32-9 TaxID=3232309 RepID=UPI00345B53EF